MTYQLIIKNLIELFYKERTHSHLNEFFFLSSHLHFAITLEIAFAKYTNEEITLEQLYERIPKKFGSRSTIKATLSEGVKNGFFIKNVSMKDKRMKVYRLNDDSKVSVESWLEGRKKLYES